MKKAIRRRRLNSEGILFRLIMSLILKVIQSMPWVSHVGKIWLDFDLKLNCLQPTGDEKLRVAGMELDK